MRFGRLPGLLVAGACAYFGVSGRAEAAACTGTNPVTCTGGAAAEVVVTPHLGTPSGVTNYATTFPATLTIPTGAAPTGSTVTSVSLRLNGYTSVSGGGDAASRDVGILLESPDGKVLQVISRIGSAASAQTNLTIVIADGGSALPAPPGNTWTTSGTFAPGNYSGLSGVDTDRDGEDNPNYAGGGGPSTFATAAPFGTSTMASALNGATVLGTWKVYLADDAGNLNGFGADVKFTSFDLIIGFSGATTPTSTSLSPSLTTAFTSGANSSVTLTATVTAGATGTVAFLDGGSAITCSGGNQTLSGNQATCTKTFNTEGIHSVTAVYNGDSTFVGSTSPAVNIFVQNRSTNTGTTYCNTGAISSTGLSNSSDAATSPYPSVIDVGDGNTSIPGSVSTVSVTLKNFSASQAAGIRMLLVAPDGTHAFDFWDGPGTNSISAGNYTIQDGSTQLPIGSAISPGTYGPTAINPPPSLFTPGFPAPAPQIPSSYAASGTGGNYAEPAGTATFETSFNGAPGNGQWSLFLHDGNGNASPANAAGGWCLTITAATGHATTTTVTSSATPNAAFGTSVSFTATVASTPPVTVGTVTFTENGAPLTGASPSSAVAVAGGIATVSTTALPEGDHTITATYHDSTNVYNDSFGTVTIRVDKATAVPTLSGSTWTYCNTGAITIPGIQTPPSDLGAASPNPSNIMVTNLSGTVSSVNLVLKHFALGDDMLNNLDSMLVGPNLGSGASAAAASFDFLSITGNGGATIIPAFGPLDLQIVDGSTRAPDNAAPSTPAGPASYRSGTSYITSPFFTMPSSIQHAPTVGAFSFNTTNGVYSGTLPGGVWSLYFNMLTHDAEGLGASNGWCLNFVENPVTGSVMLSHFGPDSGNNMRQGGTTGTLKFSIQNQGDSNNKGSTGDPDQSTTHAMTITGSVPTGLTYGTLPTSPWSCSAVALALTCTNKNSVAAGSSYPQLVIPVNVSTSAPASVTVSGFTYAGAGMTAGTFNSDTITIDPAAVLGVTKTAVGTFTQGSTGTWTISVANNSSSAAGTTDGSTVTVSDVLPSGYTLSSGTGTNWSCSGTTTVTCTSSDVVAGGGGTFNLITVVVNIPANSATSVSNTAKAFGGGDVTHTNSTNGASSTSTVPVVQVPAAIALTAGTGQSAPINTAFTTPLKATVTDAGGVAISGLTVTFTAPASGASGTFAGGTNVKTAVTDGTGVATATTYTANGTAGGPYNIQVAAGSITNNYTATNTGGAASSMTANSGTTPQSATISTAFTNALAVTVKDSGSNPVAGVSVTFTAPGSGASGLFSNSMTSIIVMTNGSGIASAPFTANSTAGGYMVTAAASGLTTLNFSLTNTAGAASTMTANSGTTPQSATISTAFANALAVTVKDSGNNPVSGVSVTFTAPGSGASGLFSNSMTSIIVMTNGSGIASAPFTANSTTGGYMVTAAASGLTTLNFSLTNTAAAAASMTANSGTTPQSATISTAFTNALAVTVKDSGNNPVSGVSVTFTAPGSGASGLFSNSMTSIIVMTNGSGIASAPFTANSTAGGYMVTAAASGLTTLNFSLTNTAGAASTMTANSGTTPQSATISTAFANALAVTVKDSGNNPVSGVSVTFTAPGSGASGLFSNSMTSIIVMTNGSGIASAPFTANSTAGGYMVTAAASGLTTLNFSLTNTAGAASTMTANSGTTPQSATISTAFANALAVTVKDSGNNPVSGVSVTFTAPGSGASGLFSNSMTSIIVMTNGSGIASAPFTANSTTGGYMVTAAASGLTTLNFSLTNTAAAAASMTANSGTTPQSATISTAFTNALAVTVKDSGNNPVSGVSVTFSAPLSGASGTFAGPSNSITVSTNASGVASATFTANATAGGPYMVTAMASGLTTVNFSLTNTLVGPNVTLNPVSQVVNALTNVTFTAAATGTPTPTVQWQVSTNGGGTYTNILNATSTTLTFQATGDLSGYKYQAVFTNGGAPVPTTAATLTVTKLVPVITWSNPANMIYGGALGSGQLNATANVGGTFAYTPPAGTVLPVGNNQTLSVTFTPTDSVNYTQATATVSINVTQSNGTPANLIVTSVLTRDPSTQEVIATVTFANSGGTAAGAVQLTLANIVNTPTTTPLPISLGTIAGNGQTQTVIRFPSTVGTPGTRTTLTLSGTFTGGTFNGTTRISLP